MTIFLCKIVSACDAQVYFDLVRVNHGLAFAIEPRFGLQWHTLSFEVASITSAQFGSQSEIPFYCSHATFAEKLSYLAHIKGKHDWYLSQIAFV